MSELDKNPDNRDNANTFGTPVVGHTFSKIRGGKTFWGSGPNPTQVDEVLKLNQRGYEILRDLGGFAVSPPSMKDDKITIGVVLPESSLAEAANPVDLMPYFNFPD